MKIYVIGSLRHLELDDEKRNVQEACKELGEAIGRKNHKLIVCSGSPNTVDPYVIDGMNMVRKKQIVFLFRPDLETLKRDSDEPSHPYFGEASKYPDIRFQPLTIAGGWRAVHLRALRDCDFVIAIGGSLKGTGPVIYSAEMLQKPVVLIPSFGGASNDAWRDFRHYYSVEERQILEKPRKQHSHWGESVLNVAVKIAKRNPFRKIKPWETGIKLALSIFSIIAWVTLF